MAAGAQSRDKQVHYTRACSCIGYDTQVQTHLCGSSCLFHNLQLASSVCFSLTHFTVCVLSCRAAAVRQELQAEMDQLPEAGPQEGKLLAAGGGPHR